jgi:hypothetical protein
VWWNGPYNVFNIISGGLLLYSTCLQVGDRWKVDVSYPYKFSSPALNSNTLGIFIALISSDLQAFSDQYCNSSPFVMGTPFFVN